MPIESQYQSTFLNPIYFNLIDINSWDFVSAKLYI